MATTSLPFLFLLLLLPSSSLSQPPAANDTDSQTQYTPQFNRPMAVLVAVLITAFFFMGFFSIYLRNCTIRGGGAGPRPASTRARSYSRRRRGLDPSVISSFPTLFYSDVKQLKLGKSNLECAVCLSDFDDADTLRLLPHCSHAFHPDCIDMWLASHTTCPVCRHNLTLPPPPQADTDPGSEPEPAQEHQQQEQVTIDVETNDEERRRGQRYRLPGLWRSRSTAGIGWTEAERERFTLRLPEHVRREVFSGKLSRSATVVVGEGRGRRGEGSGSGRGARSFKMTREGAARSDRWAFLARPLSFKFTRAGAEGQAEGLGKGKASSSVISPRDCLGSGAAPREESRRGEGDWSVRSV